MGHFHSENLSRHVIYSLFGKFNDLTNRVLWKKNRHYNDYKDVIAAIQTGQLSIKPITVKELTDYCMVRITAIQKILNKIPDTPYYAKGKKWITELMENEYANNASEGAYTDRGMIQGGIKEILAYYEEPKAWKLHIPIVSKSGDGYTFSNEFIAAYANDPLDIEDYVINEIEL
jgi:hypothetical protein